MKNVNEINLEDMIAGYQAMAAINLEEATFAEDTLNDGQYK